MQRRNGLSILELIIVVAIIGILVGLLVPAVQRVRESAIRVQSQNNLRQIMLATHNFAATYQGRLCLPASKQTGVFTPHIWILPFLERPQPKYTVVSDWYVTVEYYQIPEYLNPADPTGFLNANAKDSLVKNVLCSYPANACVFKGTPSIHTSIPDGTSNTIGFSEHYANCKNHTFVYYNLIGFNGLYGMRRATFADDEQQDVIPMTKNGLTVSSVPGMTFQVAPLPKDANGFVPNTPHRSGLSTAMMDGSVRSFRPAVSEQVFWSSVSPNGGECISE